VRKERKDVTRDHVEGGRGDNSNGVQRWVQNKKNTKTLNKKI